MNFMKVRILRGCTIAEGLKGYVPGRGDPPTFALGDIVTVDRVTAQHLVGNGKAEHVSGDDLLERAPSDPPETAAVEAPETTTQPKARARKA